MHEDYPLPLDDLPPSLLHLTYFITNLDKLPRSLETLDIIHNHFGTGFNSPVHTDNLPPNLKSLSIHSHTFNQSVDHLPFSLQRLVIDSSIFNSTLDHLPQSLTRLQIGNYDTKEDIYAQRHFNQPINNLPESLKHLIISSPSFVVPINLLLKLSQLWHMLIMLFSALFTEAIIGILSICPSSQISRLLISYLSNHIHMNTQFNFLLHSSTYL